ncbi:metal ABC transporter permease [Candidatus Mycoplasma haematobovis]|uniref:Metal ABC transporter permease n=1 Tax=Candidatus Mycoplasma haematobovis TaxID=432608 RepID=A0A1A9QD50_9MOLU|nr:energy-coupling factor transporter transmembrane component T [Candidatus Mycoplasma haematobovis]OAL09885.1 metal ABC transporter permease [Candidatus Mycoplasma haematobovis]
MFLENSYEPKDTPVHKLNPLIKFLVFLSIIFLLFLRITLLTQLVLIGFVWVVVKYSDSQEFVTKQALPAYGFLICFLLTVNFFFMKSPGFWTSNVLSTYYDILGSKTYQKLEGDIVHHGWYWGGEILGGDSSVKLGDTAACIEREIGWNKMHDCGNHGAIKTALTAVTQSPKWRIMPINVGGQTKYVAFLPAWYTVSSFQIMNAFSLANKIILVIILSAIFTMTSPLTSFTYALEDLFRPLSILRLPTKLMALTVSIALRFVPSLITESFRIIRAQASRGIDYKNGRLTDKINALRSLFIPIFVISFIKSDELAAAMTARGYRPQENRTSFRAYKTENWELLVMGACMFVITILYYLFFNKYYLSSFGNAEMLISIAR